MQEIYVSTDNIKKLRKDIANIFGVDQSKYTLTLESVRTIYTSSLTGIEIHEKDFDLHNKDHHVKQVANIRISASQKPLFALSLKSLTREHITDIDAIFDPTDTTYDIRILKEQIKNAINIKKLEYGLLVDIFDEPQHDSIENLVNKIIADEYKIINRHRIPVMRAIKPKQFMPPKINYIAQNTNNRDSVILIVYANSPVLEIEQGQNGLCGRDAHGKIILTTVFDEIPTLSVQYDENHFYKNGNIIFCKQNGHAMILGNTLTFDDSVRLEEIIFRTASGEMLLNQSSLTVTENVCNTEVCAKKIEVDGNIDHSTIKAEDVCISGSISNAASIQADTVKINIAKGLIVGRAVKANSVETGANIKAMTIFSEKCLGANLNADIIQIGRVLSNNTFCATKSIAVKEIVGENNIFLLKDGLNNDELKRINELLTTKKVLENQLSSISSEKKKLKSYLTSNENTYNTIQQNIAKAKARNKDVTSTDIRLFNLYTENKQSYSRITNSETEILKLLDDLSKKVALLTEERYSAALTCENGIDLSKNKVFFEVDGKKLVATGSVVKKIFYCRDKKTLVCESHNE